jgi:hypothetical protein
MVHCVIYPSRESASYIVVQSTISNWTFVEPETKEVGVPPLSEPKSSEGAVLLILVARMVL